MLLSGCAEEENDSGVDSSLPEPSLQHFAGSSEWLNPEGEQVLDPGLVWLRRELRAADSMVIEDLVSEDSAGAISVYRVEVLVDGTGFSGSFEDENGTLSITGELSGEAWAWSEWSSTSTYIDGSLQGYYFKASASLGDADLVQDKRVYDAEDVYILNIAETLATVDSSDWHAGLEAIGVEIVESETR